MGQKKKSPLFFIKEDSSLDFAALVHRVFGGGATPSL
jgi:hypothetical protein